MRETRPSTVVRLAQRAARAAGRLRRPATWGVCLSIALGGATVLAACAAHPSPGTQAGPALAEAPAGDVRVSIAWRSLDGALLDGLAAALEALPTDDVVLRSTDAIELAFSAPASMLEQRLEPLPRLMVWHLPRRTKAQDPAGKSGKPLDLPTPTATRALALGLAEELGAHGANGSSWTWHASATASPDDMAEVSRALAALERAEGPFDELPSATADGIAPGTFLVDRAASLPSEVRFVPAAELDDRATPEARAGSFLAATRFVRANPGWVLVPPSVDLAGRREPGYLYSSADFAGAKARLASLFEPAPASVGHPTLEEFRQWGAGRMKFVTAQLENPVFRLRALHSDSLARFEADARAISDLQGRASTECPALSAAGGRLAVVGPALAWRDVLAARGPFVELERKFAPNPDPTVPIRTTMVPKSGESVVQAQRMLQALGGEARWRALERVHLLGLLVPPDGTHQGVEQWADLSAGRFALAQAIGAEETLIVCDPAAAWIHDGRAGVDLSIEQARKFRARSERTWFAVLARLARPGHGGLMLAGESERLVLREEGAEWCWIECGPDGLPRRLGYRLAPGEEESLYEFSDWRLDGPLPYPAITRQTDRGATFEIQHFEADGKLDATLWSRPDGKR